MEKLFLLPSGALSKEGGQTGSWGKNHVGSNLASSGKNAGQCGFLVEWEHCWYQRKSS